MARIFNSLARGGAFAAAAALCLAAPAAASVFEVGDDGSLVERDGGAMAAPAGLAGDGAAAAPDLPAAAISLVGGSIAPVSYLVSIQAAAANAGVSPELLEALVWQESRWRPAAVSPKGARGLAQLMPGTARLLGVNAADPAANLFGGALYLRRQLDRFGGDIERALAAYNAGPERVARAGGIPAIAETRAYVAAIMGRLSATTLTTATRN